MRWSSNAALIGVSLPASLAASQPPSNAGLQRLGPEPREQRVPVLLAAPEIVDGAEAARVVEADDGAVVEGQHDMIVFPGRRFGAGGDPARHAEMQQQQAVAVELDQDVFAAAAERSDPRARQPGRQRRRERPPQVRPAQLGPHDPPAAHLQRETAPHRLDFRKLGHAPFYHQDRRGASPRVARDDLPLLEKRCREELAREQATGR